MNSLNSIVNSPNTGIKFIFFVHFIPTIWASQTGSLPFTYLFYNTFFLLSLFWALAHKDLEEPIFFAAGINALSILFDAIIIGMWYSYILNGWSILNAILNMIIRPITTILLIRYYNERSDTTINIPGLTSPSETSFGNANGRSTYESIDRQTENRNNPTSGPSFA